MPHSPDPSAAPAPASRTSAKADASAFAPLRSAPFRLIFFASLAANMCSWTHDATAAWLMATLTDSAVWVALVQSASTLPMFLLGLPGGALADLLDRRALLAGTQFALAAVAGVAALMAGAGWISPLSLLALTFASGLGAVTRWPAMSAVIPQLVSGLQLPAALGLQSMAYNISRILGPVLAGALIARAGPVAVFGLNAVLGCFSGWLVLRWRGSRGTGAPGKRESLLQAMAGGLQFVRQSPPMRALLACTALFFMHASALIALMPLLAKTLHAGDARVFTFLLAAMGAGAVIGVLLLPAVARVWESRTVIRQAALLYVGAMAMAAAVPSLWLAVPAVLLCGAAWMTTSNTLSVAIQRMLPDAMRARAMSIHQMAIMGASALGSGCWGWLADAWSLRASLLAAALSGAAAMALAVRQVR